MLGYPYNHRDSQEKLTKEQLIKIIKIVLISTVGMIGVTICATNKANASSLVNEALVNEIIKNEIIIDFLMKIKDLEHELAQMDKPGVNPAQALSCGMAAGWCYSQSKLKYNSGQYTDSVKYLFGACLLYCFPKWYGIKSLD